MATPESLSTDYLDQPHQWDALADVLAHETAIGYDSEFYNVNVEKESCVGRARVHVWSVAIRTDKLSPFGFHRCKGWVLPVAALVHPSLVAVLADARVRKEIHNQSVDQHSAANHGVLLRGCRNTLDLIRWTHPHLINTPGRFSAKALMWSLLKRQPVCTFKQLVTDERVIQVVKQKKVKVSGCSCGVVGCRKRKTEGQLTHDKWKRVDVVDVVEDKVEEFEWPLEQIVPGHKRWEQLKRYAIEDAIAALQFAELADLAEDPAPFPFTKDKRPGFSQAVTDEVVTMETVGFKRDLSYCTLMAMQAESDEDEELDWLFKWWVRNTPYGCGPWHRKVGIASKQAKKKGVDSVWSSTPKLSRLFDTLGFPRSPIWKKGRVKPGEMKLDQDALKWIAKAHPPAKKLIEHLIHLKRIRSGWKYLKKLRDADDIVHIICGPAGDEDGRSGAVTGRLGIKGSLEAQQLPSPENQEKDLYLVRKAIIA